MAAGAVLVEAHVVDDDHDDVRPRCWTLGLASCARTGCGKREGAAAGSEKLATTDHFGLPILRSTAPCLGTVVVKPSCITPRSLRCHKSRTGCRPFRPSCVHCTVTGAACSPRLNSPTAIVPSASVRAQISRRASDQMRPAAWP